MTTIEEYIVTVEIWENGCAKEWNQMAVTVKYPISATEFLSNIRGLFKDKSVKITSVIKF